MEEKNIEENFKNTIELLRSGWNNAANHEKMDFEEINALHKAIKILSALPTKDEFNKKMAEHIKFMKNKVDKISILHVNNEGIELLNYIWQIQCYRDTLADILPD